MAKAPTINIPITFSVEFAGHPDVLEATYQAHYLGSGPEVITELRSNAAHCLALADMIERDTAEKESAEVDRLALLLQGVCEEMDTAASDSGRVMARKLIARGVKVGK